MKQLLLMKQKILISFRGKFIWNNTSKILQRVAKFYRNCYQNKLIRCVFTVHSAANWHSLAIIDKDYTQLTDNDRH